jgi:hypothetical protein
VKQEAHKLLKKIQSNGASKPEEPEVEVEEENSVDTSGSPNPPMSEQIKQAKSEGRYPAKGGEPYKSPPFFEYMGKKWATPEWAKSAKNKFNTFKHNVIHNKWNGPEYKEGTSGTKKDTGTHHIPTQAGPTKEQRKALRKAAAAGNIGSERTLPTGPKVKEMLEKSNKELAKQPGVTQVKNVDKELSIEPDDDEPLLAPEDNEIAA